jgi:ParB-like chromosome segregation protein Spo0J
MKIEQAFVDGVEIGERLRPLNDATVERLVESMARLGQLQPITVYSPDNHRVVLIAGHHRLEAARRLEWDEIDCVFVDGDEIDRQLREVAENLHRAELTALERDEHIAKWVELVDLKSAQFEPKLKTATNPKGAGRHSSGINAAARELGVERNAAQRAVKVASLSDEAKEAAREAHLDNNRSALLEAASKPTVAEQVAAIHQRHTGRVVKLAKDPISDVEALEGQVAALMSAWNKASSDARQEFLARIDSPLMDKRWA